MNSTPAPGRERAQAEQCEVGDWISLKNAPGWRSGMHDLSPPDLSPDEQPWFFSPIYDGPVLRGWRRIE